MWALPLNKRVRVSACQTRMPHTHVFVPTQLKLFISALLETEETANNLFGSRCVYWFYDNSFCLFCLIELHFCLIIKPNQGKSQVICNPFCQFFLFGCFFSLHFKTDATLFACCKDLGCISFSGPSILRGSIDSNPAFPI